MRARGTSPLVARGLLALLMLVVVLVAARTKPRDSRSLFFGRFLKIREGMCPNIELKTYHSIIEKIIDSDSTASAGNESSSYLPKRIELKAKGYYDLFSYGMATQDEDDLKRMREDPSEKMRLYEEATKEENLGKTTSSVEIPLEYSMSVRTTIDAFQRYMNAFYTSSFSANSTQAELELRQYFIQYDESDEANNFINRYVRQLSSKKLPAPAESASIKTKPFSIFDLVNRLTYDQVYFNAKIKQEMETLFKFQSEDSPPLDIGLNPLFGNSGVRELILETYVPYYANTYMPKFHEKFGISINTDTNTDQLIEDTKNILFVIGCLSMYHVLDEKAIREQKCSYFHIIYGMFGKCEDDDANSIQTGSYSYSMERNPYVFHVNKGSIYEQKTPNGKTYARSNEEVYPTMEKVRFIQRTRRSAYKTYSQILDNVFFDRMFADFNDHKTSVSNFVKLMNELDLFEAESSEVKMKNMNLNTKECAPKSVKDIGTESTTEKTTITVKEDIIECYSAYKDEITVDLMRVGAMRFCVEFTNALLANRVEHIVGDVRSLSRTARASYEAKESLDLGDFYY